MNDVEEGSSLDRELTAVGIDSQELCLLRVAGVSKSFGPSAALRHADMVVGAGEVVAVMGPSGSGKSTLLHCMAGILVPDSGTVEYGGRRINALSDADRSRLRRTDFGFVFQFGQLIGELDAVENVALPLLMNKVRRREALVSANSWLEALGIGELARRRPHEMSGGQAQRVAIARAMVTNPKIIFADEPTGSLDSVAGMAVLDAFTSAARSRTVAVVIVTHEPRVAAYASRTITVRDGEVQGSDRLAPVVGSR